MNRPPPQPELAHPFDMFFALPIMMGSAALSCSKDVSRQWWHNFFRAGEQHKEDHAQLAVPEPLELDDERDLFA